MSSNLGVLLILCLASLTLTAVSTASATSASKMAAGLRGQVIFIPPKTYLLCWKGICDPRLLADLGKRTPFYNFGLGKRANSESSSSYRRHPDEDDQPETDVGRPMTNFWDGIPEDQELTAGDYGYGDGFDTGYPEDFGSNDVTKRSRYGFGIGKKGNSNQRYNFGLGKRDGLQRYNFGLGKRSSDSRFEKREASVREVKGQQDIEDEEDGFDGAEDNGEELSNSPGQSTSDHPIHGGEYTLSLDKRSATYGTGQGKRKYSFGLGKRARMYDFGLGKRLPMYNFGLGKKDKMYSFGLGKRKLYSFGLGKREVSESYGRPYRFGLGKRAAVQDWETGDHHVENDLEDHPGLDQSLHLDKRIDSAVQQEENSRGHRAYDLTQTEGDPEKRNRFMFGLGKRIMMDDAQDAVARDPAAGTTTAPSVDDRHQSKQQ